MEIQHFHKAFLDILKTKGIDYKDLRAALTPQQNKYEAAFLFDEQRCGNSFIAGVECANALFKLLPSKTTHSILGGELNDRKDEIVRELLGDVAVVARDLDFKHSDFCYALYVNNLSQGVVGSVVMKL